MSDDEFTAGEIDAMPARTIFLPRAYPSLIYVKSENGDWWRVHLDTGDSYLTVLTGRGLTHHHGTYIPPRAV